MKTTIIEGDVAGRDIIKNSLLVEINEKEERELMYKRLDNLFCKNKNFNDLYVELHTDMLEQANAETSSANKGCSVFSSLLKKRNIFLVGGINSGKTISVLQFAKRICLDENEDFPIYIDVNKIFLEWVKSLPDDYHNLITKSFEEWLINQFNIQISKFKKISICFIWDHLYCCSLDLQDVVFDLINSLCNWFPESRHICTSRVSPCYSSRLGNPLIVKIESLNNTEVDTICRKYDLDVPAKQKNQARKIGDLFFLKKSEQVDAVFKEIEERLKFEKIPNDVLEMIKNNIGKLAWHILINDHEGLSFYEVADILSKGNSRVLDYMVTAIRKVISPTLLRHDDNDDKYYLYDFEAMIIIASKEIENKEIIDLLMKNIFDKPSLLDILQYCPKNLMQKIVLKKVRSFARNKYIKENYQKTEIVFRLISCIFDKQCKCPKDIELVDEMISALINLSSNAISSVGDYDHLGKIISHAQYLKNEKRELEFKKIKNKIGKVHIMDGDREISISVPHPQYDIYASTSPLTIYQICYLLPKLSKELIESVISARRDIWNIDKKYIFPDVESLLDPVVGLSFANAKEIVDLINKILLEKGILDKKVYIPTIGDWSFLDTKPNDTTLFINSPETSLLRPMPCGLCGANAEGIYDVHGNIMEWTVTSWGGTDYNILERKDLYELGGSWDNDDSSKNYRMLKGGSWLFASGKQKCSCILPPDVNYPDVGMRLFLKVLSSYGETPETIYINIL